MRSRRSARRGPLIKGSSDPVLAGAARAIEQVVRRFSRARDGSLVDDIEGEAWRAYCEHRPRYDATKGTPEAYFRIVVRRELGRYLNRALARASVGRNREASEATRDAYELDHPMSRDVLEAHPDYAEQHDQAVTRWRPDVQLDRRERAVRSKRWRERMRSLLRNLQQDWPARDRWIVARLAGLDEQPPERPRELAARTGIPVRDIYRVHCELERVMWSSPEMYRLWANGEAGGVEDGEEGKRARAAGGSRR